jgi:hypothetical protein
VVLEVLLFGSACTALGAGLGGLVGERRKKWKAIRQRPINLVQGILLPEVDDPRWRAATDWPAGLQLGDIRVRSAIVTSVDFGAFDLTGADVEAYVRATLRAYAARVAQKSIEADQ